MADAQSVARRVTRRRQMLKNKRTKKMNWGRENLWNEGARATV